MFKAIEDELKIPVEIKEGFTVTYKLNNEDFRVYSSTENELWGLKDLNVVMTIEKHVSKYEVIVCLGQNTYKAYGEISDILEELNGDIYKYFYPISKNRNIEYRYK